MERGFLCKSVDRVSAAHSSSRSPSSATLGPLRDARSTGGWGNHYAAAAPFGATTPPLRGRTTRAITTSNKSDKLGMARTWAMPPVAKQHKISDSQDCDATMTPTTTMIATEERGVDTIAEVPAAITRSTKAGVMPSGGSRRRGDDSTNTRNSNPLEGTPFLPVTLDVPKSALNAHYGKRYKSSVLISKSCFTTWNDGGPSHNLRFTSVFTCPVTGERFRSARYGHSSNYTTQTTQSKEGIITVEVIWYTTIHLAEHAAAARALDCISLREGKAAGIRSYGICIEQPYMSPDEAPPLPLSAPSSLMVPRATALAPFRSPCQVPKMTLNTYLGQRYKNRVSATKSCYSIWDNGAATHILRHTAVFKCPITGECFRSGRYGDESCYVVQEEKVKEGEGEGGVVQVIWYEKKNLAEHAAAARALDCYRSREGVLFSKLCVEVPYEKASDSPPLPPSAPDHIRALFPPRTPIMDTNDVSMETDAAEVLASMKDAFLQDEQYRMEYRTTRSFPTIRANVTPDSHHRDFETTINQEGATTQHAAFTPIIGGNDHTC